MNVTYASLKNLKTFYEQYYLKRQQTKQIGVKLKNSQNFLKANALKSFKLITAHRGVHKNAFKNH